MTLYSNFCLTQQGSPQFFSKLESMLVKDLKNKTYQLTPEELFPMLDALSIQKSQNEELWQPLLTDLDKSIQLGTVNNIQIFHLMRALSSVGLLDADVTKTLVDYLVKRGYDSDDL